MRRKICLNEVTNMFEIKPREIAVGIGIAFISLALMFTFGESIVGSINEKSYETLKATHIDSAESFQYGIETGFGDVLAYSELVSNDPITNPEIGEKCMYIEKVTEQKVMHVSKNSKGIRSVHYTWEVIDRDVQTSSTVSFLGSTFDYSKVTVPTQEQTPRHYFGNYRYYYNYIPDTLVGSLHTFLTTEGVSEGSYFYAHKDPNEVVNYLEGSINLSYRLLYIVWVVLTAIIIIGFFYFDNRWLDGK